MADNTDIEAALKSVLDTLAKSPINPAAQAQPLSTDPIPPEHHLELIGNVSNIVDYVSTEVAKHKQLLNILESFNAKINESHSILSNKNVVSVVQAEKKKWYSMTTAHKIEAVIVAAVFIIGIVTAIKFLI